MTSNTVRYPHRRRRGLGRTGVMLSVSALLLSGCAGSVSEASDSDTTAAAGYEYGADEATIKAAFAEMEPVTLTYQPAALSENDLTAPRAKNFAENVERLSDGKITIEIVYAQAIAPYPEVPDALADGRVDIANVPLVYFPQDYPIFNSLVTAGTELPLSPLVGEVAATAAMTELYWETEGLVEELAEHSMYPILPVEPTGQQAAVCKSEMTQAEDWDGAMIRGSSATHISQVEGLEATSVSMTFNEIYEALQRNVMDCTLSPLVAVDMAGMTEVAPYINYTTEASIARGPSVKAVGAVYETLPLAAKQLLFDQAAKMYEDSRHADLNGAAKTAQAAREAGGGFYEISPDVQQKLKETSEGLVADLVSDGSLPEDTSQKLHASYEKWLAAAEESGLKDEGAYEDLDQWYSRDSVDLEPFSTKLFEEVFLKHRPSAE